MVSIVRRDWEPMKSHRLGRVEEGARMLFGETQQLTPGCPEAHL
jgi:hypothetical protein